MFFKKIKAAVMIAAILALLPLSALGQANTYYDKGNTATEATRHTLTKRMALVGHNCMVSRLIDGISVGSGGGKSFQPM